MEMGIQVLSPTVEYGKEADLSSQMLRIGSDGGQGLVCGSKQNAVNERSLCFAKRWKRSVP
jgi:hypothetical protein